MTEQTRNVLAVAMTRAVCEDDKFTPVLKMLAHIAASQFECEPQDVAWAMIIRLRHFMDTLTWEE